MQARLENGCVAGMENRMYQEVTALAPQHMKVKVLTSSEAKHSAWKGGSVIASLSTFYHGDILISRSEYQKSGVGIVHRK